MSSLRGTLNRGNIRASSGGTVATTPQAIEAGSTRIRGIPTPDAGFISEVKGGAADVMHGRITLIMLDTMILALLGFYVWTHSVQGGG